MENITPSFSLQVLSLTSLRPCGGSDVLPKTAQQCPEPSASHVEPHPLPVHCLCKVNGQGFLCPQTMLTLQRSSLKVSLNRSTLFSVKVSRHYTVLPFSESRPG